MLVDFALAKESKEKKNPSRPYGVKVISRNMNANVASHLTETPNFLWLICRLSSTCVPNFITLPQEN